MRSWHYFGLERFQATFFTSGKTVFSFFICVFHTLILDGSHVTTNYNVMKALIKWNTYFQQFRKFRQNSKLQIHNTYWIAEWKQISPSKITSCYKELRNFNFIIFLKKLILSIMILYRYAKNLALANLLNWCCFWVPCIDVELQLTGDKITKSKQNWQSWQHCQNMVRRSIKMPAIFPLASSNCQRGSFCYNAFFRSV